MNPGRDSKAVKHQHKSSKRDNAIHGLYRTKGVNMGLDITAYKNLTDCDEIPKELLSDDNDYVTLYDQKLYHEAIAPQSGGRLYKFEEEFVFRAGSYSGYNHWRASLCRFALNCE